MLDKHMLNMLSSENKDIIIFIIIKSMGIFQTLKGSYLCSPWSDLTEFRTRPRYYGCPRYIQV